MRANARGVFLGSLLGFLLAIGWWTYREYRPEKKELIPGTGRKTELNSAPLGISAFIDDQLQAFRDVTRGDPFVRLMPTKPRPHWPNPEPRPAPRPAPTPQPEVKPPPPKPKPAPPPKQGYTIEYKGLFTRSDGRTAAFLRDGKTGKSAFFAEGDTLNGMKIGRITQRQVNLVREDGTLALLGLGEPQEF